VLLQPLELMARAPGRWLDAATAAPRLAVLRTVRFAAHGMEDPAVPAAAAATHPVSRGSARAGDDAGSGAEAGIFALAGGNAAGADWLGESRTAGGLTEQGGMVQRWVAL